MSPDMQPTPESSSVAEIGYDDQAEEVWVTFDQSGTYVYSQVPQVVWDEFRAAASKRRVRQQRPEAQLPVSARLARRAA